MQAYYIRALICGATITRNNIMKGQVYNPVVDPQRLPDRKFTFHSEQLTIYKNTE